MKFTFRQLELYIALAETSQISKAAAHCHISQSAMTIAMRNLEDAVNTQLFVRYPKGIRLTPAGERFLTHARDIINNSHRAIDDLHNQPDTSFGKVTVGIAETLSAYLLPGVLNDIEQRFPLMEIKFEEAPAPVLLEMLRENKIDFVLMLTSNISHDADLHIEAFIRSPRRLWANPGHPLLSKSQLRLTDVEKYPFILLRTDEYPGVINEYWKAIGKGPDVFYRTNSFEVVRSLVAQGRGVTILSDLVYRPWSLEGQRILRRTIDNCLTYMDVGVVRLDSSQLSRSNLNLLAFIRELSTRMEVAG